MKAAAIVAVILVASACTASVDEPSASTRGSTIDAAASTETTLPGSKPPSNASSETANPKGIVCWTASPGSGSPSVTFAEETLPFGLVEPLTGMHGHAAAWGNLNGDDQPDLAVGTFANRRTDAYEVRGADGPSPDRLLTLSGGYSVSAGVPARLGRTSGMVIVDLDNDGDDDVVLSRNMRDGERSATPTQIYRNDQDGFTAIDLDFGRLFSGRSVGVLDYNHDGRLDLFMEEDRFGSQASSVLLENRGGLEFRDVTTAAGLPAGVHGLGVATSDLNGDGWTDLFVAGSNRLFVGGEEGFREADSTVFVWETYGNEDDVAGAAIADLNRDGLPDLVVGHHFNSTLSQQRVVPVRVYLNQGNDTEGFPVFVDVTEESGMVGLPTKAPHVEIADFDNDGWPDILTTASAEDGTAPAVFRHVGIEDGVPRFEPPTGLGSAQYWVSGPTADVNHDGRLDLLLVEWEPTLPSLLMINTTSSGNWLEVSVGPQSEEPAIGSVVEVWTAGHLAEPDHMIGTREIVASQGYTAGNLQVAHFGLGEVDAVDVRVTYPSGDHVDSVGMVANAHIRVPAGCVP